MATLRKLVKDTIITSEVPHDNTLGQADIEQAMAKKRYRMMVQRSGMTYLQLSKSVRASKVSPACIKLSS